MEKNEDGELEPNYKEGLFVGEYEDGAYIIYNHLDITVKTHQVSNGDELRIVGFEVEQKSIQSGSPVSTKSIRDRQPKQYIKLANGEYDEMEEGLTFSYSIKTVNDEATEWSHRLDHYYAVGKYDVHMK